MKSVPGSAYREPRHGFNKVGQTVFFIICDKANGVKLVLSISLVLHNSHTGLLPLSTPELSTMG
jgi:hypothetical protein